ncbi:peptidoglycan DD-metalloendopeptidase family protein [Gymnodinialimonas sp. 2305UL16-5]|uniref:murein hydrolase activator EnvC family protein n=1 Tax=Gymnodinialimonas mytili TaxID=3126503 RepID=UPI0030A8284A
MIRLVAALWLIAAPLAAQSTDPVTAAQEAIDRLESAAQSLLEAERARDRVEALTETVRAYELGLNALRAGLRDATTRERTILLVFEAERDRLGNLLSVLQRIEAAPAPATLLHPEGPLGTARLGMIVADLTPAVAREAQILRGQLQELSLIRQVQGVAVTELETALDGVQTARTALSQAIADRVELPPRFALNEDAMRQIAISAESLGSLAALLQETPVSTASDAPRFETARGVLPMPVLGTLLRRFGETDAAGVTRPGQVLAVPQRGLITAPWAASIRYAGPLTDYGNVIILEPQADYLLVMAGAGDIFVTAGDLVPAGAPLGLMPGGVTESGTELIVSGADGGSAGLSETLYMELRQGGRPVDPAEWFAQP